MKYMIRHKPNNPFWEFESFVIAKDNGFAPPTFTRSIRKFATQFNTPAEAVAILQKVHDKVDYDVVQMYENIKIAITGHRPDKLENDYALTSDLVRGIKRIILDYLQTYNIGELTLISGMALGIDTLFAFIALHDLHCPLIAAVPFKGQESRWNQTARNRYNNILYNPLTTVHTVSPGEYSIEKMQARNRWMVDNCDLLISVWDGTDGGTANCTRYAKSIERKTYRINPKLINIY